MTIYVDGIVILHLITPLLYGGKKCYCSLAGDGISPCIVDDVYKLWDVMFWWVENKQD
jgi:hypothetical protein